ncbi:MAG: RtcB family protein [Acidobacteria bacterium]|nr:RtcB family protein [Acidobacteriota bacterium]
MNTRELVALGIPSGPCVERAKQILQKARASKQPLAAVTDDLKNVAASPATYVDDERYGQLARQIIDQQAARDQFRPRASDAPYQVWGDDFEPEAVAQMRNACKLPVAVSGALMPDAHVGYGLPIGGVLATRNAVIPYAVGVDIACRMKMSVLDLSITALDDERPRLTQAIEGETRFGVGATFRSPRAHDVMDEDWSVTALTAKLKDRAWSQLGTSGSGNHFVEFGELAVTDASVGLAPGRYVALLSHSGSRGTGAQVADHYGRLARARHPELPKELAHLAWLDLDSEAGQEYWAAMELMGHYAAANHAVIHRHVIRALGVERLLDLENHHNFAWRERHVLADGSEEELIVHRKGATPAGQGVLGIIPGSMGTPGFIVRGRGVAASLNSAAHGAGRRMSRKKAKETFSWNAVQAFLVERNVTLLSGGLNEVPMAYKDIEAVMAAQRDLVEPLARFDPRLVKMAQGGEPPED